MQIPPAEEQAVPSSGAASDELQAIEIHPRRSETQSRRMRRTLHHAPHDG
jgi:hypothetical protein